MNIIIVNSFGEYYLDEYVGALCCYMVENRIWDIFHWYLLPICWVVDSCITIHEALEQH